MVCSSASHSQAAEGALPFVKAEAETSNTSAEVVKVDPHCCWKSHSRTVGADVRMKVQSLMVFSNYFAFNW